MAIPFNVENEPTNCEDVVLQVLLADLSRTLQQIEIYRRSRIQTQNRVPPPAATARQSEPERTLLNSTVDLAVSLSEALHRRRQCRRSRTEPSCCKSPRPLMLSVAVEVTNKDWKQMENITTTTRKWYKLKQIVNQLSGPLWTVALCVLGWCLLVNTII